MICQPKFAGNMHEIWEAGIEAENQVGIKASYFKGVRRNEHILKLKNL